MAEINNNLKNVIKAENDFGYCKLRALIIATVPDVLPELEQVNLAQVYDV